MFVPYMKEPLIRGELVDRVDRFVAMVKIGTKVVRAHCINPGRMEGFVILGATVWLQEKRRQGTKYTWELILKNGVLCSTNTLRPNAMARALIESRALPGLDTYVDYRAEKDIPATRSRCDFWLLEKDGTEHWVEVKNCHMVYDDEPALEGYGYFPDSVTARGARHCRELGDLVNERTQCTVLLVAMRKDARKAVRISRYHDPTFHKAALTAREKGVRFRAVRVDCGLDGSTVLNELPVHFESAHYKDDLALIDAVHRARSETGWTRSFGRGAPRRVANGPFPHHTPRKCIRRPRSSEATPTTTPTKKKKKIIPPSTSPHFLSSEDSSSPPMNGRRSQYFH